MQLTELQNYLVPIIIAAYFMWRFYRGLKVKNAIPELMKKGAVVVDVRSPGEFQQGARPGSVNIPLNEISKRAGELDKTKTIILCCASGTRSGMAATVLKQLGFSDVVNAGSWRNTLS